LFHDNGLPHGKGYLHDKEKAARQLCVARQRQPARQRSTRTLHYGRTAKPLPCNIGEPHGKELVAIEIVAVRRRMAKTLPCI
jgi:hypothetical protein